MISLEKTGRSRSTANINSNNNTIVAPINPLKKSNLNPTPVNINFVNSASVAEPNNSNLVNSSSVPLLNVNLGHVNFPVNQVNPAHTNMITSINNPTINYNGQGYGVSASGLTFSFGQNSS
jgi:hypothetical protein